MALDFRKYAENIDKLKALKTHELIHADEQDNRIAFTPQDEVAMRHEIMTPDNDGNLINRSSRMANLNAMESIAVKKAGMLVTWLESMRKTEGMKGSIELDEFVEEVKRDMNVVCNISVSRKGWLIDNILSPVKKITLSTVGERKSMFAKKNE